MMLVIDMIYTSIHNEKIKFFRELNNQKKKDEFDLFLVEGEHLVEEATKAGFLREIIVLENEKYNYEYPTYYVNDKVMKYISNLESIPNIIGICDKSLNNNIGNKILILDNIQDPGNLGTIIRSAVAFNIDTIIMSKDTAYLFNSKVVRASQGMIFYINFIIADLEEVIKNLKEKGYKIWATNVNSGKSLKNVEIVEKFAIIMGNEGKGVSKTILDLSDDFLCIDMNSNCESLNVAVATSIILYELNR